VEKWYTAEQALHAGQLRFVTLLGTNLNIYTKSNFPNYAK